MKRYLFVLSLVFAVFKCLPGVAQTGQLITGTVSDKNGTLPGVNVYEKSATANGAVTDEHGKFSIRLRNSDRTLVFSMIGYLKKEVTFTGKSVMNITMEEDVKGLEEVVIIGYGETKKITNTGAVSSIGGTEIRQSPASSLQNTLTGRLPGFFSQQRSGQPGKDGADFQIRGVTTYAGTTTPMIIVDDIEITTDQISLIDANEIESVTILKDASTTAVYGVRGANGVIIITTQRGQAGKPHLTFRNETGIVAPNQTVKVNDGYSTLKLLKENLAASYLDPATQYPQFFSGDNLQHYATNDSPYLFPNVDWWKEITKSFSTQNRTNLDISGGTQKAKYFVSLGYFSQGGLYKDFSESEGYNSNYAYDRYNFRSNLDLDPTDNLHIRVDLSGRFSVNNTPNVFASGLDQVLQWLWNGDLSSFYFPAYNANGTLGGSTSSATKFNPIALLKYAGYNRTYDNNLGFVAQAKQKLNFVTNGLSASMLVSYSSDYGYIRSLTRGGYTGAGIATYYYDANTGGYLPVNTNLYRNVPLTRSGYSTGTTTALNLQASLNYSNKFGNNNINGLLLLNQTTKVDDISSGSTTFTAGDPYNVRGITGRIHYDYKQKYLLDISGAYNGSDKFSSSKQYQLFPSVSVAWNISEEPFFKKNINFIDLLKLRGSYGMVGNDGIGTSVYSYVKTYVTGSGSSYYFGPTTNTASAGLAEPTLANTGITWETQRDLDIGVDLKLLNGKVNLSSDYFKKRRSDILTKRGSVASAFGASLPYVNLGIVDNSGYEIELKYNGASSNHKFTYFVDGQISYAQNKIVFMDEGTARYPWLGSTGKPVGAIFGYTADGLYQNLSELYTTAHTTSTVPLSSLTLGSIKLKDLNEDGVIDQYDMGYLGTNQPTTLLGFSLGFSYKGFDFSSLFQGATGNIINIRRGIVGYSRPWSVSIPYNLGRWTPVTGTDATFPALYVGGQNTEYSSYWIRKDTYIRWKNIEIGYRFPADFAKKIHLNSLRLYANGYNMGLIYSSLPVFVDPESTSTISVANTTLTNNEYPQQRIFNFGLQIGL